ncbi:MAG: hypothetical protein EAZ62_03180 [Sphingobacteriia bacterium]|nr:MAG: hypothetical protein EAZ62_03180 [Sphingobacteriia bacterium]
MLKDLILSIGAYWKAHRLIRDQHLWKWILVPGLVYAFFFYMGLSGFSTSSSDFIEWVVLRTGLKSWLDRSGEGWTGFFFTMGGLVFWLNLLLFYLSLFKYLFLLLGAPLLAFLNEKTQQEKNQILPTTLPIPWIQRLTRAWKMLVRNALWQSVYLICILLVSLIPVVGWLTPLLAILIECYYLGLSLFDYSMERKGKSMAETLHLMGNRNGLAIGIGSVFIVLHLVPLLGWILAPGYAMVAATICLHDHEES